MAISPARHTAFRILKKILLEEGYASELLHSESTQGLKEEDKRLATELVFGVVRHCQLLDWLLSAHSQRGLSKLDPEVLLALRLGTYQILFLTRVPPRAIVHESVELVKHAKLASAAGFVNAVLRKIDKQEALTRIHELPLDSAEGLSIRFSHPEWLVERWIHQFGLEPAKRLLEHNNTPPRTFFRINSPHLTQTALMDKLSEAGVKVRSHALSNDILEVIEGDLTQDRSVPRACHSHPGLRFSAHSFPSQSRAWGLLFRPVRRPRWEIRRDRPFARRALNCLCRRPPLETASAGEGNACQTLAVPSLGGC